MIQRRSILPSAAVLAIFERAMGGATAIGSAAPVDESTDAAGCQFTLTPPELVLLPGGAKAVRATMNPKTCDPSAQPTDVTVCLSTPNSPGQCKKLPGWSNPQVIIPASP